MRTPLALSCLVFACATTEPIATPTPQAGPIRLEAAPKPPPPQFDAKGFAADQLTPIECEKSARHLYELRPEQGWAALVACIDRSRWPRGCGSPTSTRGAGCWCGAP